LAATSRSSKSSTLQRFTNRHPNPSKTQRRRHERSVMLIHQHDSWTRSINEAVGRNIIFLCCQSAPLDPLCFPRLTTSLEMITRYARRCNPVARSARAYDISAATENGRFQRRMSLASLDPFGIKRSLFSAVDWILKRVG
jgi:hypothetical protein